MADIINLRMARKARKRLDAAQTASENRARFGQKRIERLKRESEVDRQKRVLGGARRDPDRETSTE
ncbi:MAG: DUF4169 family protein [Sphingobium sp.]